MLTLRFYRAAAVGSFLLCALTGCATATAVHAPRNFVATASDIGAAEYLPLEGKKNEYVDLARLLNRQRCDAPLLPQASQYIDRNTDVDFLSVGDILDIAVTDGDEVSAHVEIDRTGHIRLPLLGSIQAAGRTTIQVENEIAHQLVRNRIFKRGFAIVSATKLQSGARIVHVSGAVFLPGVFTVNQEKPEDIGEIRSNAIGEGLDGATVADALRRAAGIRPDADIANVILVRGSERRVLNLSGAFNGTPMENTSVLSGDEIIVPSRGCFQEELARVSAVTTPGVKLFMSNLTQPASSNALSAIGRDSVRFAYGSRLHQALVSANCVGGTQVTNANRYVVYMTRNWETGRTVVFERPIEAIVRRADRDNFNPYLQEGDAIACYDSVVTNARDIIRMLGEVVTPIIFTRGLIGS